MSGHSKWSQIKRQKGAADAKRSTLFTKLGHAIASAARDGADPAMNFKLRLAIEKARGANMPKGTIERAIAKGSGQGEGAQLEDVTYEGFGPAKVAVMITALTDNRNRTTAEVRRILTDHGGGLGGANSIGWLFEAKGVLRITREHLPTLTDDLELALIDTGAEDIQSEAEGTTVLSAPGSLERLRTVLTERGLTVDDAGIELIPKDRVAVTPADSEHLQELRAALEDLDDVSHVFTNAREQD